MEKYIGNVTLYAHRCRPGWRFVSIEAKLGQSECDVSVGLWFGFIGINWDLTRKLFGEEK